MIRKLIEKIQNKLHPIDYSSVEYLRSQGIKIGENVDIINSSIEHCHSFLVSIGNNVTITNATILAHDASTKKFIGYSKVGRVDIGNDVFIGYGAIVLPNTRIGNKVIVGAGTVVAKDVPDNVVIVGNPFRVICTFDEYIERNRKKMKQGPTYNTLWYDKSEKEKNQMIQELAETIGYDL